MEFKCIHVLKTRKKFSFSVSSVICGLHVYKVVWENTAPGEKLCYQHEVDSTICMIHVDMVINELQVEEWLRTMNQVDYFLN